jgi:predicted lipoprotein with Yx(FWY)xxD motif
MIMKKVNQIVAGVLLSISFGSAALAAAWSVADTGAGKVFAGEKGLSLYTFRKDTPNQSNCYDDCATAWPPFLAKADAKATGAWTLVKRNDGSMQWALKGMPLYYWIGDSAPGETSGDGVGGVWDLARP